MSGGLEARWSPDGSAIVFTLAETATDAGLPVAAHAMSPEGMRIAALKAATSGNAGLFGRDQVGTIAPGMLADLIAVQGNPLANMAALSRIRCVHHAGRSAASCATVSRRER